MPKASHVGQISADKIPSLLAKPISARIGVEHRAMAAIQMAAMLQGGCVPAG